MSHSSAPQQLADLKTKLFVDTSEIQSIRDFVAKPFVQGVTTNPSLMRKAGVKDYKSFCKELLTITRDKPISFEIFADELNEMERQANEIASWGDSIYVKIPITNSKGISCTPLIQKLTARGIKLNITAIMTLEQVDATCTALKDGAPAFVSVFAGRVADTGRDPLPLMQEARQICERPNLKAELLWASTREVFNIFQANAMGCAIITVPPDLLKKLSMLGKDLNELSLETVQTFKADAESAGFSL